MEPVGESEEKEQGPVNRKASLKQTEAERPGGERVQSAVHFVRTLKDSHRPGVHQGHFGEAWNSLELLSEHTLQLSKWHLKFPKPLSPLLQACLLSQLQRQFLKCMWAHSFEGILQGLRGDALRRLSPRHTRTHTDSTGREGPTKDDIWGNLNLSWKQETVNWLLSHTG